MHFARVMLAALLLVSGPVPLRVLADDNTKPKSAALESAEGLLTASGRILMPDGTPAAGAIVQTNREVNEPSVSIQTDDAGHFLVRGCFGRDCLLHAATADGRLQAVYSVSAVAARLELRVPIELKLRPAVPHDVTILTSDDQPAVSVQVFVGGDGFRSTGVTERDGRLRLWIPEGAGIQSVTAWHPKLGVDGRYGYGAGLSPTSTVLRLCAPGPHTIRVIDLDGNGVGDLELAVTTIRTKDSLSVLRVDFKDAHLRTSADGSVIVPWMPKDQLQDVHVDFVGSDWKETDTNNTRTKAGVTTVDVCRRKSVVGRLVVPAGINPEGILITGDGFGPGHMGDTPLARCGRDGTFTFLASPDHGYALGITDLEWATSIWTGVILKTDSPDAAPIEMECYPATPVTIRITRGLNRQPVVGASILAGKETDVEFPDRNGETCTGLGGVHQWLTTDAKGEVRIGARRGEMELRLDSESWSQSKNIDVPSVEPMVVEFHRPWIGERILKGRLIKDNAPYRPSTEVVARGWTPDQPAKSVVQPDGTLEVKFDSETLSLLVIDSKNRLSGYAEFGPEETDFELSMRPTCVLAGTLTTPDGKPVKNRLINICRMPELEPRVASANKSAELIAGATTDQIGRFRFESLPSGLPLEVEIVFEEDRQFYYCIQERLLFEFGEVRENASITAYQPDATAPDEVKVRTPLATRVKKASGDANRSRMLTLVVLLGDGSEAVTALKDQLLDDEDFEEVYRYLPVVVSVDDLDADREYVAANKWPIPAAGEIALIVLNSDQVKIADQRIAAEPLNAATTAGVEFIRRHAPPIQDALQLLADAEAKARATGRLIWYVESGPRCWPCFMLARWMEEHHKVLEKDFVVLKVMSGVDKNSSEVAERFPHASAGIPWFALAEPGGKVLATSDSRVGNIGMPSSIEGTRHLRKMLEKTVQRTTPEEIDGLVKSLLGE